MVEKRTGHNPGADFVHLTKLVAQAVALTQQKKVLDTALEAVRRDIKNLIRQHETELPLDGSSRYWRIPKLGVQARLTYPSDTPTMDYEALRKAVGDDVFKVITKATTFELVPEEVNIAIQAETLTESQLMSCLKPPIPRDASLYIEGLTPERKEGED